MGQRGPRKARRRCGYVDPILGQRCRCHVKRAGNTFCTPAHAAAARPSSTRNTIPGARARHRAAQEATRHRLDAAFRLMDDETLRLTVAQMLLDAQAAGYASGYHAGLVTGLKQARALRLTASKAALDEFVVSKFGKSFIRGDLRADDLANFSFSGTRPRVPRTR